MPGAAAPGGARVRSLDSGWNRASGPGERKGVRKECATELQAPALRPEAETPTGLGTPPGARSPESTDVAFRHRGSWGVPRAGGASPGAPWGPVPVFSLFLSLPPPTWAAGTGLAEPLLGPGEGQRPTNPSVSVTENIKGTRRGELSPERR